MSDRPAGAEGSFYPLYEPEYNCRFRWTERGGRRECTAVICDGNTAIDRISEATEAATRRAVETKYPGIVYRNGSDR